MTTFAYQNGQFLLDGEPVVLQAGEFHYYRAPRETWRERLERLKAAGFNTVAAYMPWLWHQVAPGESDFDGHSHPMRDLAGFLDLAAELGLWIIARPGPYIMAESNREGIPNWVFDQHPDLAYISQDGKVQNVASYLHPHFLEAITPWYQAIFQVLAPRQVTRGGRIIMVQLDNEMGMIQWVRNIFDINPDTLARFAAFLCQNYGSKVGERYPAANSAPEDFAVWLGLGLAHPAEPFGAMLAEDYRRFYRIYMRDYAAFLLSEARACGLEVPPVINVHGFANGGKTFPIGLSQLIDVMELEGVLSATDVYPIFIHEGNYHQLVLVNEITKAVHNPQQPLFSMEFQAGGNQDFSNGQSSLYDLYTRLCISNGLRGVNHYLFFDGENDPIISPVKRHDWGHPVRKDGSLRRHYARYPKLSAVLNSYGQALALAQPFNTVTIGFVLDDFMTEVNNDFTQPPARIITHQRDEILNDFIAKGLAATHRPFNAIELERAALDPVQTPLLFVMVEKARSAAIQQKLADYARQGGRLALVGRVPEEDGDHQPCTILKDALGITQIAPDAPFTGSFIHAFGIQDIPVSFLERYQGQFDEVFATTLDGATVGWVKQVGQGLVLMLGASLAANTLDDLAVFERLARRMGCSPLFEVSDWADIRLSVGERGSFLYANNYQDDPVEPVITCQGRVLFDGQKIHIPARQGLILPLDWQVRPGVVLKDLTCEVREVIDDGSVLCLKTSQEHFWANLALTGWHCENAVVLDDKGPERLVRLEGHSGWITIKR